MVKFKTARSLIFGIFSALHSSVGITGCFRSATLGREFASAPPAIGGAFHPGGMLLWK
jgi:hypothetical protein